MAAFESELFIGLFQLPPEGVPAFEGRIDAPQADSVVKVAEEWTTSVDWYVQGTYLETTQPDVLYADDKWQVHFYLEGMGRNADEKDFGPIEIQVSTKVVSTETIPADSVSPGIPLQNADIPRWTFTANQTIPANTLQVGIYKIIAAITYQDSAGNPKAMAGFSQETPVQVYEAV
jgi:hypothetical protein